jgi:CheY-like chemotaxis protein
MSNPEKKRTPKVLIVDDEPSIVQAVRMTLTSRGYQTEGVYNGEACLEALRHGFKGVILMDVFMQGLDGWATIQKIVSENLAEGNIICMLTGAVAPDKRGAELDEYVVDYLCKPFTPEQLISMVESAARYLET